MAINFYLRRSCVSIVLLLVTMVGVASAYEVSPMRVALQPSTGQVSTSIVVNNTRDTPLPVEIQVFRREVAVDGSETFPPADENFVVFPPQALVQPGTNQAIRIQYIGPPQLANGEAYIVSVNEVPVEIEGFSGIQVAFNFGVALYLLADTPLVGFDITEAQRTEDGVSFQIANTGNDIEILHDYKLVVTSGKTRRELSGKELRESVTSNPIIPPGQVRDINLQLDDMPGDGEVSVNIRY